MVFDKETVAVYRTELSEGEKAVFDSLVSAAEAATEGEGVNLDEIVKKQGHSLDLPTPGVMAFINLVTAFLSDGATNWLVGM